MHLIIYPWTSPIFCKKKKFPPFICNTNNIYKKTKEKLFMTNFKFSASLLKEAPKSDLIIAFFSFF